MPVAKHGRRRTHKPIVVERLDDGNGVCGCRSVDGWRGSRERVVDVHDLRPVSREGRADAPFRRARPDRRSGDPEVSGQGPRFTKLGVVEQYLLDLEPGFLKQQSFGCDHLVLATRLAIAGVDLQYPLHHGRRDHDLLGGGLRRITAIPSPNNVQNQIPPWGPSRYGSNEVLTTIAVQYTRIHAPTAATFALPLRR